MVAANRAYVAALVWVASALAIALIYWACLRFAFPGYFAPISPFDSDFYDYVGMRDKTLAQILHYPRPVAYMVMMMLGALGLKGLMAGGIAISLLGVLLTAFLVARLSGLSSALYPIAVALYAVLLFAHPEFYFEHRHDLPAEVSFLFAILSLVFWQAFVSRARGRIVYLVLAVASAILFAFAKETYFVSMLCLAFGLALFDQENRKLHLGFFGALLVIETVSFLWTRQLNGPFVNTNAAADSTYRISLAPLVVAKSYWFYLSHLFNFGLVVLVAMALFLLRSDRRRLGIALAFLVAGLATFAPHAVLPNHQFEEYAWAGAALVFAPVLMMWHGKRLDWGAVVLFSVLAWNGYRQEYRKEGLRWMVNQDRIAHNVAASLDRLKTIPPESKVLVAGLQAAYFPWQSETYLDLDFGRRIYWAVFAGPNIESRRSNRLAEIVTPDEVQLKSFDRLVMYEPDGSLRSIRLVADVPPGEPLIPGLAEASFQSDLYPKQVREQFLAAALCIDWKLWPQAKTYLEKAERAGGKSDPTYRQLVSSLEAGERNWASAEITAAALTASPARIVQPDGSQLGDTELSWTVPMQRSCEIRVGAPDGKLFTMAAASGKARTGKWIVDGTEFFLQDVTAGKPLTAANTLARVKITVRDR